MAEEKKKRIPKLKGCEEKKQPKRVVRNSKENCTKTGKIERT
jgi:hypothetical protein